jgi:hypothetical protein
MPTVYPIDFNNPDLQILVDQSNTVVFFSWKGKIGKWKQDTAWTGDRICGNAAINNFLMLLSLYRFPVINIRWLANLINVIQIVHKRKKDAWVKQDEALYLGGN